MQHFFPVRSIPAEIHTASVANDAELWTASQAKSIGSGLNISFVQHPHTHFPAQFFDVQTKQGTAATNLHLDFVVVSLQICLQSSKIAAAVDVKTTAVLHTVRCEESRNGLGIAHDCPPSRIRNIPTIDGDQCKHYLFFLAMQLVCVRDLDTAVAVS